MGEPAVQPGFIKRALILQLTSSEQLALARVTDQIVGAACDTLHNSTIFFGDPRAPSFSDEDVEAWCNAYQTELTRESKSRIGIGSGTKKHYYELNKQLPMSVRRAMCERIWVEAEKAGVTLLTYAPPPA
jgi:hypothetical protein